MFSGGIERDQWHEKQAKTSDFRQKQKLNRSQRRGHFQKYSVSCTESNPEPFAPELPFSSNAYNSVATNITF